LAELCAAQTRALGAPRQVARFLCGLSSPAISAAKLTRHPLYGALAEVPFAQVLAAAGEAQSAGPGAGAAD
jgi:ATP-dependent DNA helicase RecQ